MALPTTFANLATKCTNFATYFTALQADDVTWPTDKTMKGEIEVKWQDLFEVLDEVQDSAAKQQTKAAVSPTAKVTYTV